MGSLSSEDDQARFRSVVLPHLAQAYALARWLTGNRADAEDVVQEACLRAFRAIGGFAGVNARAWVLTIVRNTAYSWLAKNRTPDFVTFQTFLDEEQHLAAQYDGEEFGTSTSSPEAALIAKVAMGHLEAAIAALPVGFREVLIL